MSLATLSVDSPLEELMEISYEFGEILENMKVHDNDQVVAYYGELEPILETLKVVINKTRLELKAR